MGPTVGTRWDAWHANPDGFARGDRRFLFWSSSLHSKVSPVGSKAFSWLPRVGHSRPGVVNQPLVAIRKPCSCEAAEGGRMGPSAQWCHVLCSQGYLTPVGCSSSHLPSGFVKANLKEKHCFNELPVTETCQLPFAFRLWILSWFLSWHSSSSAVMSSVKSEARL